MQFFAKKDTGLSYTRWNLWKRIRSNLSSSLTKSVQFIIAICGKKLNEKYHLSKKESTSPIYIYYINDNGRLLISKQKISLPPTITNIELSKEMIAYCEQFIFKNLKGLTKISEDQALTINVLDYLHNSEVIKISDCLSKNFP